MASEPPVERNLGLQPLDAILQKHGLTNHTLSEAADIQLTHKAIQRARKGRRLTPHMQKRITETLNAVLKSRGIEQTYVSRELFTY